MPHIAKRKPPKIAAERREAYAKAIRAELKRRVENGEPISSGAIAASAKYDDGTAVSRTTLYAKRQDGTEVHAAVLKDIKDAQLLREADSRPSRKPRSAASAEREISTLRSLTTSLCNDLQEARQSLEEANKVAASQERAAASNLRELYVLATAIVLLTDTHNRGIRHWITTAEQDPLFQDYRQELGVRAQRLADQIKMGTSP